MLSSIRDGWSSNSNDYTTECPHCHQRFVARFTIQTKEWKLQHQQHQGEVNLSVTTSSSSHGPTTHLASNVSTDVTPGDSPFMVMQTDLLSPDSLALFNATKTLAAQHFQSYDANTQIHTDSSNASNAKDSSTMPLTANSPCVSTPPSSATDLSPPLVLEYLSPFVLKKELVHLLELRRPTYLTSRRFRESSPAIFWNILWHSTNQCLPIDFIISKVKPTAEDKINSNHMHHARANVHNPTEVDASRQISSSSVNSSSSSRLSGSRSPSSSPSRPRTRFDCYERVLSLTRSYGVGREFGYGSGGFVAGVGAVGISLGAIMRSNQLKVKERNEPDRNYPTQHQTQPPIMEDDNDEEEDEDDD